MAKTRTNDALRPKQVAVLNEAQNPGLKRNISAILQAADVPHRTFYNWLERDQRFKQAWENVFYSAIRKHLPGIVLAQIHKAYEGDTKAAEYVAKLSGVWVDKQQTDGKLRIEVEYVDDDTVAIAEGASLTD